MRIVVHDFGGYPFTVQLARALARRGHHVLYLHSTGFVTPKGQMQRQDSDPETLHIEGLGIEEKAIRSAAPRRLAQERRYGAQLAARIEAHRAAVVLSANCPLDAQSAALAATHRSGAAFAFWMQDYYSHAIRRLLDRRLPLLGRLVAARFAKLERRLLRASDSVVAASADFLPVLERWGVAEERISHIPNWAPIEMTPQVERRNAWAIEHGLDAVPVFAYAGTLGRKHNPSLLLDLATALPETKVVVVSEGLGTDWLQRAGATLPNLILMPLQPAARLAEVLATADVLVALLERDASEFSEPSKVLTYLAAGRPILAAIPAGNRAAKTIREADAGVVVEPTDARALVRAGAELIGDADQRIGAGRRARAYAERHFDIAQLSARFEAVLIAARSGANQRGKRVGIGVRR